MAEIITKKLLDKKEVAHLSKDIEDKCAPIGFVNLHNLYPHARYGTDIAIIYDCSKTDCKKLKKDIAVRGECDIILTLTSRTYQKKLHPELRELCVAEEMATYPEPTGGESVTLLPIKMGSIITMFNQNQIGKVDSASTSSHAMSGRVTPCLQSIRYPCGYGGLLNQGASNAFLPFHYWKPCLIERSSSETAILNFSSYLSVLTGLCLSLTIQGIRAVRNVKYYLSIFISNLYYDYEAGYASSPDYKSGVSATPAPHGVL